MEKMVIVIGPDGRVQDVICADPKLVVVAYQQQEAGSCVDETERGLIDGQLVEVAPRLVSAEAARCARVLMDLGVSTGDIAA